MRIVFYTSGITGSGRIVRGIAIGNALRRNDINCDFIILNSSPFSFLIDKFGFRHVDIPVENEIQLSRDNYSQSNLYNKLVELNPDILIVDLLWFSVYNFIEKLDCKKIFLCNFVFDRFFTIQLENHKLSFNPDHFDLLFSIEPFKTHYPMKQINSIVLRNKNEIMSRDEALAKLGLNPEKAICLYAFNNHPGDFDKFKDKYSYLENIYQVVYSTNYKGGIFPVVDYFNVFDFIVCSAGYNMFWEVIYFNKEVVFENHPSSFSSTEYRIEKCQDYLFEENGADQLVSIFTKL